jgi:hypothetical protein
MLGGKCVHCGFSDWRALQIDHIHHVGKNREKQNVINNKILMGETEDYQLLCANCNWIKRHEEREFHITHFELEDGIKHE